MSNKQKKSNIEKVRDIKPKKRKQYEYSTKYIFKRYKFKERGERHPKLITDTITQNGVEKHVFMGLTESEYSGHHKNIEIKNPNTNNSNKKQVRSYLRKEQRIDNINNFSEIKNYYLHKEDEAKVDDYVNKKKK